MARVPTTHAILECLRAEGVDTVFGVPGGQTLSLMDAIYDAPDIRFVTARHELGAACMADGYGRATGRPGVFIVTTGPGATNSLTGVAGATRDSSPVVAITVNNRRAGVGWDEAQDADHVALFQSITKHSRYIDDEDAVVPGIREALRYALSGNPGAAHVDFAREVLEEGTTEFDGAPATGFRASRTCIPDSEDVNRILDLVGIAKQPVMWVGNGVKQARCGDVALEFAERFGIPVVTTFNGIGAVDMRHPNVFGPRSRSGTRLADHALRSSDLVLVVGNSLNAVSTSRWTLPLNRTVQVDIDPYIIGRHYPLAAALHADAASFFRLALAQATEGTSEHPEWLASLATERKSWEADVFKGAYRDHNPIKPQFLMQELSALLEPDDILIADAGNPGIWAHVLPIARPDGFMKPVGFGNMAFALPAAIATKLALPDRRVVVLIGDGSLGMSLGELETATREGVDIGLVVMNDLAYGNIKQEQLMKHGPRYVGVDFTDVSYVDIARAMGGSGEKVCEPGDLRGALERCVEPGGVRLLDVRIDGAESVWEGPI